MVNFSQDPEGLECRTSNRKFTGHSEGGKGFEGSLRACPCLYAMCRVKQMGGVNGDHRCLFSDCRQTNPVPSLPSLLLAHFHKR